MDQAKLFERGAILLALLLLAIAAALYVNPANAATASETVSVTWIDGTTEEVSAADYVTPLAGWALEEQKPDDVVWGIDGSVLPGDCFTPWFNQGSHWVTSCKPIGSGDCNLLCEFSTGAELLLEYECGSTVNVRFFPDIGLLEVFEN